MNAREKLEAAGFCLIEGQWRRHIDTQGFGETPEEREINDRGGLFYGYEHEAETVLAQEIDETLENLAQYSAYDVQQSTDLRALRDWAQS